MRVMVDTSVWSLLLRRRPGASLEPYERRLVAELEELTREGRICMVGLVRQELLSGIRSAGHFETVKKRLRPFDDFPMSQELHEQAAKSYNYCVKRGLHTSVVDILICTVAKVEGMPVLSTDPDLERICRTLSIPLHEPREFP